MKNTDLLIALATSGIAAAIPAHGANLLVNRSFEDPVGAYRYVAGGSTEITGWTTRLTELRSLPRRILESDMTTPTVIADGVGD